MNNKVSIQTRLRSEWKSLLVGLVLAGIGIMFLCWGIADGWDDFRLIQRGMTTSGFITATWEEPTEADSGGTVWSYGISYSYILPDGRQLEGTLRGEGRLNNFASSHNPLEVVYLPDEPTISSIKGEGPNSILDIFRHQFLHGYIGIAFLIMGFYVLWVTIRYNKKVRSLK